MQHLMKIDIEQKPNPYIHEGATWLHGMIFAKTNKIILVLLEIFALTVF